MDDQRGSLGCSLRYSKASPPTRLLLPPPNQKQEKPTPWTKPPLPLSTSPDILLFPRLQPSAPPPPSAAHLSLFLRTQLLSSYPSRAKSRAESDVMDAGGAVTSAPATTTTTAHSVLHKPLHELTEDDISQLTREDCRRYLQEKGMRRPSWNKSQAIQQVICLKSLLEPSPPSPPPDNPPPVTVTVTTATSNSCSPFKDATQADEERSVSAPESLRESVCPKPAIDNKTAASPRSLETTDLSLGQITLNHSGKVHIYEGVSVDRAQTMLHLAAGPFRFSRDEQTAGPSAQWTTPMHFRPSNTNVSVIHPHLAMSQPIVTGMTADRVPQVWLEDVDGYSNRLVSLQKYREKKRDRGRFKSRDRPGPPGLDVFFNHHIGGGVMTGQSSGSITSSSNLPGQLYPLFNVVEYPSKNPRLSVDINDKV